MSLEDQMDLIEYASTQVRDVDANWESDFVKEIEETKKQIEIEDSTNNVETSVIDTNNHDEDPFK
ncbi:MAG: hypothetical protein ACRCX2_32245 [Paraclostridium sp.]